MDRKASTALLSILSNTTLVLGKIVVGLMIGSVSIVSEAIHSGVDLLAAIIAFIAVRTSGKPADDQHPFGHGKIENISGTVEALLIFLAAIWIINEALHKLLNPRPIEAVGWGVAVMLVSAVVNTAVSHMLYKVGNETDSVALKADAWHLRTDVYTSIGVMTGLALIWVGERFFPQDHLLWLDPIAAIAVALLITKAAYGLTKEAAKDLLDVRLPEDEELWIRASADRCAPTVANLHDLRTRKAGAHRYIEFHITLDPAMTVIESHSITEAMRSEIEDRFPGSHITIYVDPIDG